MNKHIKLIALFPFAITSCGSNESDIKYIITDNTIEAHYLGYGDMGQVVTVEDGGTFHVIKAKATYHTSSGLADAERIVVELSETVELVDVHKMGYKLSEADINPLSSQINTMYNITSATKDYSKFTYKNDENYSTYLKFHTGIVLPAQKAFNESTCEEISNFEFDITKKDGSGNDGITGATGISGENNPNDGNPWNWSLYLATLQDVANKACDEFSK